VEASGDHRCGLTRDGEESVDDAAHVVLEVNEQHVVAGSELVECH
jgi:hypothetical protein